jgi:uncharacterized membrane protein
MALTLIGVLVVVAGFALRLNPFVVVVASALVTGLLAHMAPLAVLAALGKAFNDNRLVSAALIAWPLIGVLERAGLRERARALILKLRGVSVGRFLIGYLVFRQVTAAIGLLSVASQTQTVRPLAAPMAEAAAERDGPIDDDDRQAIRAQAAATENIGAFFAEDVFVAVGSLLLMVGFMASSGIVVDPVHLAAWALPTALAAFVIQATRLMLFERRLRRKGRPA